MIFPDPQLVANAVHRLLGTGDVLGSLQALQIPARQMRVRGEPEYVAARPGWEQRVQDALGPAGMYALLDPDAWARHDPNISADPADDWIRARTPAELMRLLRHPLHNLIRPVLEHHGGARLNGGVVPPLPPGAPALDAVDPAQLRAWLAERTEARLALSALANLPRAALEWAELERALAQVGPVVIGRTPSGRSHSIGYRNTRVTLLPGLGVPLRQGGAASALAMRADLTATDADRHLARSGMAGVLLLVHPRVCLGAWAEQLLARPRTREVEDQLLILIWQDPAMTPDRVAAALERLLRRRGVAGLDGVRQHLGPVWTERAVVAQFTKASRAALLRDLPRDERLQLLQALAEIGARGTREGASRVR